MEHPERPSRHRNHDKWKRIIEPAGDSDSSEWSSDSDVGVNNHQNYRHLDTALNSGTSSNGTGARERHSPPLLFSAPGSSVQGKQPRDSSSSLFRTIGSYSFMFDPAVAAKRYEVLEPGGGPPANNFNHLLHHDYAEREVNNERGNGETPWYPMYNPLLNLGRKKKWMDPSSNPSTSTAGPAPEDISIQESDNANNLNAADHSDDDRWRAHSNRPPMNSPARKRPLLESMDVSPAIPPPETSEIAVPGCSSVSPVQSQPSQTDGAVASSSNPGYPSVFFSPSEWYVQKKVQSRCKQQRFNDGYRTTSGEHPSTSSSVPEDYSTTRPADDSAEVQVLAMAGPSNSSSRIVYPTSSRHLTADDPPNMEEPPTSTQGPSGPADTEDEGVEVIMVDDTQPIRTSTPVVTEPQQQPVAQQKQQQQPQEQQQQVLKDEENLDPPSAKSLRGEAEILNQGLIGLLECPVCMEYMGPPIHQCRRGHLVCCACKPKLPSCPTCRSRFTESRNLAMEKVADKLHYPCKNAHVGCTTTLRLRGKDDHEANCVFRSFRCIMVPPCEWRGLQPDILGHVKQVHPSSLLLGPEHVLEMRLGDFTEQSSQNWVVSALGELFRVNLGAVRGGRVQVFGCVLYLGPARYAPRFQYTLLVGPTEGDVAKRKMSYSRATHCYVERCSVYYSAGDSFHLRTESAQLFSMGPPNDRVMRVRLRIEKAE